MRSVQYSILPQCMNIDIWKTSQNILKVKTKMGPTQTWFVSSLLQGCPLKDYWWNPNISNSAILLIYAGIICPEIGYFLLAPIEISYLGA